MTILRALRTLALVGCSSAFVLRNDPLLNSTTEKPAIAFTASTWRSKVHGESSGDGWDIMTSGSDSRVRTEPIATNVDVITSTIAVDLQTKSSVEIIDIGTVISGMWPDRTVTLTVHWEKSATGWGGTTLLPSSPPVQETAHVERSTDGWGDAHHLDPYSSRSSRSVTVDVSDPWTSNLRTQATAPGRPQSSQARVTTIPSKVITEFPLPPAITHDGVTIQPIAVTHRPTVNAPDGSLVTTDDVKFQVVIGSSTLSTDTLITINNVVVGLTSDSAGSTVIHVGDLTTTLPKPTAGEVRTVARVTPGQLDIVTSIVGGTTKYVIAGQTLAPGQPVTIDDTPISISVDGGITVLHVGDKMATLVAAASDTQILTDWPSMSVGTQGTIPHTSPVSSSPTSTSSALSRSSIASVFLAYYTLGMVIFVITT
ncbi:hypothetical protein C7974DRAFT_104274 [Boeremia exigua]|uniref:uncharacterized protein n=1 Tax=Boeremia exigua TaxID=749465 RepID=UPI001E8E3461|nr:uncharacterized protein C7974DRAFT_104274 [Boeremia exigua]KAH6642548.1 hypothetical protein C7974DRAFT_104274 [Boeremia exigua]